MFQEVRPMYVLKQYAGKKFPQKPRSSIKKSDVIHKFKTPKIVDKKTKITTLGSCFAQRLRDWLVEKKFNYIEGHWDRVYSPRTVRQTIQMAFEPETLKIAEPVWKFKNDWGYPYIKERRGRPLQLPNDPEKAKSVIAKSCSHFNNALSKAEVLIVTYGQTEVWSHKDAPDTAFYAAPFQGIENGNENHICKDLTIDDIRKETELIMGLMKKHNPDAQVIFSISPIPPVASISKDYSAYIASNHTKSKLHAAVLEEIPKYKNAFYMPSFEWVYAHPYKAFTDDGRHVPQSYANSIMGIFEELYVKTDDQ